MRNITAIVIPVDEHQPMRVEQVNPRDVDAFQQLVGGLFEVIHFERPDASLYCNDEAKLTELPINVRATAMAWAHNRSMRNRDSVNGDALLVGVPDARGVDKTVPKEYLELIFGTYHYRVSVRLQGETVWRVKRLIFPDPIIAYIHGARLAERPTLIEDYRVVRVEGDVAD